MDKNSLNDLNKYADERIKHIKATLLLSAVGTDVRFFLALYELYKSQKEAGDLSNIEKLEQTVLDAALSIIKLFRLLKLY